MTDRTIQFLLFGLFTLASLCGGYTARRKGWLHEDLSRPIHFHTVVWVWSLAALLSLWRVPPQLSNLWLLLLQPALMAVGAYTMIPLAKWLGCSRPRIGVMALSAGISNNGFTLGAYLCYIVLDPPEQALALGMAFVITSTASSVLLMYPLARCYGAKPTGTSWARQTLTSFADPRAMPMYAAMAGVVLAVTGVPFPAFVDRLGLLQVVFYLGGFGAYLGIGLRLRLGDWRPYLRHHAVLAAMKFLVTPVVAVLLLNAINQTPWPLGHVAREVVVLQALMPTAILSVMLANLFHLDARMASMTWVWNTVTFLIGPLPLILWLVPGAGPA